MTTMMMIMGRPPPPYNNWMLPFYRKQHLILLALPLALGTFLSLHQSFLFSSSSNENPISTASLKDEEEERRSSLPDFGRSLREDNEDYDDTQPSKIAWLLSYPNSGTSYTMTLVEQATNRSTATNYGIEVTDTKYPSVPIHADHHPEGPYWEGTSAARRAAPRGNKEERLKKARIRPLPDTYVLTKTHCGGRCVRCGANDYVVPNTTAFLRACARTTARLGKGRRIEAIMDPQRVHRVVHLIRNPYHNIIARFHLEGRNMIKRDDVYYNNNAAAEKGGIISESTGPRARELLPMNATGFRTFCRVLDQHYIAEEEAVLDPQLIALMRPVPCRAEFFKYVQWHNYVGRILTSLGPPLQDATQHLPVLTLHYEHYHDNLDLVARRLIGFLDQQQYIDNEENPPSFRPFRELPTYDDHFTDAEREAATTLMRTLATPWTWERIKHYLE